MTAINDSFHFVWLDLSVMFFLYFYVLLPWEFPNLGHAQACHEFDAGGFSSKIYSTSVSQYFEVFINILRLSLTVEFLISQRIGLN